jgi:hypothetical protein
MHCQYQTQSLQGRVSLIHSKSSLILELPRASIFSIFVPLASASQCTRHWSTLRLRCRSSIQGSQACHKARTSRQLSVQGSAVMLLGTNGSFSAKVTYKEV